MTTKKFLLCLQITVVVAVSIFILIVMMESPRGQLVQVVLDIKGGPFIVVASLNGNKLESTEIKPAAFAQFNTQLLWQADKRYVKRLRTSNTALKIECHAVKGAHSRRERIGYILLNLKEAQIVSKEFKTETHDSWHKLLGIKNDIRPHCPEILLSFRIEDAWDPEKEIGAPNKEENNEVQIGPMSLNTRLYCLTVKIKDIRNFERVKDSLKDAKITYSLMGKAFNCSLTDDQKSFESAFELRSTPEFLVAYFKQFPNLVFNVSTSNGSVVGFGSLDLHGFMTFNGKKLAVQYSIPIKTLPDERDMGPYLDVELTIIPSEEGNQSTSINTDVSFSLKTDRIEIESNSKADKNSDVSTGRIEETRFLEPEFKKEETKNVEVQTESVPQSRDISTAPTVHNENDVITRQCVREVAIKTCEELEDWREKQEEMFNFELKQRAERHMNKLTEDWEKKRHEMEHSLLERIAVCNKVFERVEDAYKLILQQSELMSNQEKELLQSKTNLDRKYTMKFQELRKASLLLESDMKKAMNTVINENTALKTSLQGKNEEITRLKESLAQKEQACKCQKKDFIFSIENQISELKDQLDKALTSKVFFKEQWARAIRELQLMKESEKQELRNIIEKNHKNMKSLGLISDITHEVDEMRRDQGEINSLRKELEKLGSF